ncbi:hypothetical protein QBC98_003243 [Kitasatospora acidiphila]
MATGKVIGSLSVGTERRGWFAELTAKKLRRGIHRSVRCLEHDIRSWLADWNEHPQPFVWTKTSDEILAKVAAYCQRISDSGH